MSGRRSGVKGAASFRRLLRRLPDSSTAQLLDVLSKAGPQLAAGMRARVHSRTGRLAAGIGSRVTPKSLNLKVGILNKKLGRSDLFYGHILDVGRKAKAVTIRKGARKGETMNVTALAPLRLEYQGLLDFKRQFLPDYRRVSSAILADAAKGAGDD